MFVMDLRRGISILIRAFAFAIIGAAVILHYHLPITDPDSINPYQDVYAAINYMDFGAIRRGLLGTVFRLAHFEPRMGMIVTSVACCSYIIAQGAIMLSGLRCNLGIFCLYVMFLFGMVAFWALDAGRSDSAIAAVLLVSLVLAKRHPIAAAFVLSIGLLMHEIVIIFGIPLVVSILYQAAWDRIVSIRAVLLPVVILAAGILLYLCLPMLPHAETGTMIAIIRENIKPGTSLDVALYFLSNGARGVQFARCQNVLDPNYMLHLVTGIAMICMCLFALAGLCGRRWLFGLAAAFPPFLVLWIIALDVSRWITFSLFSVWLVCAALGRQTSELRTVSTTARLAVGLVLAAMYAPGLVWAQNPIFSTSSLVDNVAHRLGGEWTPDTLTAFVHCDPNWRDSIAGAAR